MNRGYVKVWRKIEDSGIMGNVEVCQMLLYLLVKVSRKKRKYLAGNQVIDLLSGQSGRPALQGFGKFYGRSGHALDRGKDRAVWQ